MPCRQARFKLGDVQHMFHSEESLNILLGELGSLSDRLRFSQRDWDLARTCLASMANVLGDPQHAINVQHLASEVLLNEVAAQDEQPGQERHVGDWELVEESGSSSSKGEQKTGSSSSKGEQKTIHLKPTPKKKCVGGSGSSSSADGPAGAKPKPKGMPSRKRPLPSPAQEKASEEPSTKKPRLSIGWCPQCHCMREECFKPGDWACLFCGQHNYADKETCSNKKCKQRRAPIESYMVEELPTACRHSLRGARVARS